MDLFEYQGKQLFARYGIPVSPGGVADTVDEAVAIANDSAYGLSGSVWSADPSRALGIARRIRTGTATVNGWRWDFNCPFGGFKESGLGREGGPEGLEAYCEYQTISLPAPLAELSKR